MFLKSELHSLLKRVFLEPQPALTQLVQTISSHGLGHWASYLLLLPSTNQVVDVALFSSIININKLISTYVMNKLFEDGI